MRWPVLHSSILMYSSMLVIISDQCRVFALDFPEKSSLENVECMYVVVVHTTAGLCGGVTKLRLLIPWCSTNALKKLICSQDYRSVYGRVDP